MALFILWLVKHQHEPEAFESGGWALRTEGTPLFLELDEAEFRKEFRGQLPLTDGPPASYLLRLFKPDAGPVDIESMIFSDQFLEEIRSV